MALFAIGDLHLSFSSLKPMDVFGANWINHVERLSENWNETVKAEDTVVLCGDTSWGINLDEALADFQFIERLPGKKLILKGNHDYWWTTVSKMKAFLEKHDILSIDFLHNNCFICEDYAVCGSRGWFLNQAETAEEDIKMQNREAQRILQSVQAAKKAAPEKKHILFLHYPPYYNNEECVPIINAIKASEITECFYGHIHSFGIGFAYNGDYSGINLRLVSADAVNFVPHLIK